MDGLEILVSSRSLTVAFFFLAALPCPALAQSSSPAPDGYVVWQSNRQDSRHEIYRARADGSAVTRMTTGGGVLPTWAPDGRWISFMDESSAINIMIMRPDGSELRPLAAGWEIQWMHDNSGLLVSDAGGYTIYDPETGETSLLFSPSDFPQFSGTSFQVSSVTHDNRYVLLGSHLYINGYTGANGSFISEYSAIILDLLQKDKIYFLGSGCWPFTPPQGDLVFHICANCPTHPDIYHMHLADLDTRSSYAPEVAHEDADWGHEYNPRVSNDNHWIAYMASAGCHQGDNCDYDIWLHELGTEPSQRLRVTEDPSFDGYPQVFVGPLWQATTEPRLLVTPNRLTFHASARALPAAQLLKLKNTGGGTLGVATVASAPPASWLDVVQSAAGITVGLRNGANLTRGTQCTNLTITVPGALGSPVTVPVTLIADDTFPGADAGVVVDAEVMSDVGLVSEAGPASDTEAAIDAAVTEAGPASDTGAAIDAAVCEDAPAIDAGVTVAIAADAAGLDCDTLAAGGRGGQGGQGAVPGAGGNRPDAGAVPGSRGGCGCSLSGTARYASPLASALAGLAMLVMRRRRSANG